MSRLKIYCYLQRKKFHSVFLAQVPTLLFTNYVVLQFHPTANILVCLVTPCILVMQYFSFTNLKYKQRNQARSSCSVLRIFSLFSTKFENIFYVPTLYVKLVCIHNYQHYRVGIFFYFIFYFYFLFKEHIFFFFSFFVHSHNFYFIIFLLFCSPFFSFVLEIHQLQAYRQFIFIGQILESSSDTYNNYCLYFFNNT